MAEVTNYKVRKLEDLALKHYFDELVYKATPETTQYVRDLIDQQLWAGTVKKTVRETFVAKLDKIFDYKFNSQLRGSRKSQKLTEKCKNYSNPRGEKDILHEYAPLDCVLDEHFTGLTVRTPIPAFDSFPKLMAIIARRSPKLEDLAIWFYHCPYKFVNIPSSAKPSSSIVAMPNWQNLRFECLTHLDLHQDLDRPDDVMLLDNEDPSHHSTLSYIGKHCPVLISLRASFAFCLKKKHLLGLILNGEVNEQLFTADDGRWSQDMVLEGLQVPTELLNPLCSTLQGLSLTHMNCLLHENCHCSPLPLAVYAFTLRHLPKLRDVCVQEDEIGVEVFEIIHKVKEMGIPPHQTEFEEACRDVAASAFHIGSGKGSITSPTPLTHFPLMEKLHFPISLSVADSVRAIGSLFPHLKKAKFVSALDDTSFNDDDPEENEFYTEELVSLLSGWSSEIDTVTLDLVKPEFVKLILDAFGANLTTLRFVESCQQIDFERLASYSKLQKLSIKGSMSTIKSEVSDAASHWTSDTIFPSLTTFCSYICLGTWAPLIEKKSTKLTYLNVECCHIGTQAHNPRLEWTQIPELWPNVEMLIIKQCTGLTMTTVSKIIPQLKKLEVIELPHSVWSQDPELTEKIKREFKSVSIIEQTSGRDPSVWCPFLHP